ncbi:hypothetical protein EDD22DRAFT_949954 [Suillus occidentalis]|nr:hypothetical protein EDD22DRAFT_949954 [Suillus occidentalis]
MPMLKNSIASLQWLDLACNNNKNTTSIMVTLEAQFVFEPQGTAHPHRPGQPRILPGNGLNEPTVLITTRKVAPLKTLQQQLNHANLDPTIDLLEEIFASSIADRVRKTVFDCSWKKSPSTSLAGLTQDNIFQDGSRTSLPFPPLPAPIQRPAATPRSTRRNISTLATPAMLTEGSQRPDFETWFLANQRTHGTPSRGFNHSASGPGSRRQPTPTVTPTRRHELVITTHQRTIPSTHHRTIPSTRQRTTPSTRQRPTPQRPNIPAASYDLDSMYVSDSSDSISSVSSMRDTVMQDLASEQGAEASDGRREPMWDQPSLPSPFAVYDSLQHLDPEQLMSPPPYDTIVNNQPVVYIQNGIIVRINQTHE